MKKLLILFMLWPSLAFAVDPWTTQDTVLEGVFLGVLTVDCGQTAYTVHRINGIEENPLYPKRPSIQTIRNYCVLFAVSHVLVSYLLPHKTRTVFQVFSIAIESSVIYDNYRDPKIGFRLLF